MGTLTCIIFTLHQGITFRLGREGEREREGGRKGEREGGREADTNKSIIIYKLKFLSLSSLTPPPPLLLLPPSPSSHLKLLTQTLHLLQLVLVTLQLPCQGQSLRLGLPGPGLRLGRAPGNSSRPGLAVQRAGRRTSFASSPEWKSDHAGLRC